MKLVVIGGGSVRSPFLAKTIITQAKALGIHQVVFQDSDAEKLRIFGGISRNIAMKIDPSIEVNLIRDAEAAVQHADIVITTIRVGGDEGRAMDERIALKHGVLGQETTGAGGFSMALRSVPALMKLCERIKVLSNPGVLVFNFTNPSGIVTQALRDSGYDFVYGICDAPSGFIKQLQRLLEVSPDRLTLECFGLNHLSWFRNVAVDGNDVTMALLDNPRLYCETEMKLFSREVIQRMDNAMPNEYLYFYLFQEQAIAAIKNSENTRGETIMKINQAMLQQLAPLDMDADFEEAFSIYMHGFALRENSYMAIESGLARAVPFESITAREMISRPDDGGYAGVALAFVKAWLGQGDVEMVLSIPNGNGLPGLLSTDVVEVSCRITKGKVMPKEIAPIPEVLMNLIRTVKSYERYAVKAIQTQSKDDAVTALMFHPLVNSYSLAVKLVDDYLDAFREFVGEWH